MPCGFKNDSHIYLASLILSFSAFATAASDNSIIEGVNLSIDEFSRIIFRKCGKKLFLISSSIIEELLNSYPTSNRDLI